MSGELEIVKKNVGQFLAMQDASIELVDTDEGPVTLINGENVPVYDSSLQLKLIQSGAVSGNPELVPHINKFYIEGFEESYDKLHVLPVCVVNYSRVLYDGKYTPGEKKQALCRSSNGVTPAKSIENPRNDICAEVFEHRDTGGVRFKEVCPCATWDNGKPECALSVTLGFLVVEFGYAPVHIMFHGKAISPFNTFQKKYKETQAKARIQRKSIKDYVVELSVKVEGAYCVPVFNLKHAPDLEPKQYAGLVNYYASTLYRDMAERAEAAQSGNSEGEVNVETVNTASAPSGDDDVESFNITTA